MGDITRVGVSVQAAVGTTITVPRPAAAVNGDILVAGIVGSTRRAAGFTVAAAPAGWVLAESAVTAAGAVGSGAHCYAREASNEPGTWVWTIEPGWLQAFGLVAVYRGAVLPVDAADDVSGGAVVGPVTTSKDNARLFLCAATFAASGTVTAPVGMTTLAVMSGETVLADEVAVLAGPTGTRTIGAGSSAAALLSGCLVALVPGNRPPFAPTLVELGTVDFTRPVTFRGVFEDADVGDRPTKRGLRRKVGAGAYEYWDGAAWQPSEATWETTTADTETFAATGGWANGVTYDWSMRYQDTAAETGPWAADSTVVGSAAPTVQALTPAGTISSLRPTGTWDYTDAEADPQERFETKIFTETQAAAPGFDPSTSLAVAASGVVVSAAESHQIGVVVQNFVAYRHYVRAAQPGGLWSDWDHTSFSPDVEPPGVPVVTVTPGPGERSVVVDVAGADTTYLGLTTHRVERSDDGGGAWGTVRGATALVPDGTDTSTVTDWEAPPHRGVLYRAVVSTEDPGDLVETVSATAAVTLRPQTWALKDPLAPADNIVLTVFDAPVTFGGREDQAVFTAIGDPAPVVLSSVVRLVEGELTLLFFSAADFEAFDRLRQKRRALLLQAPWADHWYVRLGPDAPTTYNAAAADVDAMTVTVQVTVREVMAP